MATLGLGSLALCLAASLYLAVAALRAARLPAMSRTRETEGAPAAGLHTVPATAGRRGTKGEQPARLAALLAALAALAATVAAFALFILLVTVDLEVRYVYEHVSRSLPLHYRISAFWSGQEGSLLLWLWFSAGLTAYLALGRRARRDPSAPAPSTLYAVAALAVIQAFLALILLATSNPFVTLPAAPPVGRGLNPLLQNIWMVVHPPVVFAAYAAYAVPFALALSGLITGQMDADWLRRVRSWALLAWLLLGTGILMGAYWAYLELGWGGYWGWDPVENASLVPWLAGTALLHSLRVQQRRGAFRLWNLRLIALTFVLCLLATFITRSGVIQSVHAFGRSPIGAYLAGFIALCILAFALLLRPRRQLLRDEPDAEQLLSRESGFLLTNVLLCGTAAAVLAGTLYPALAEALQGRQVALAVSFFERTFGPLALLILLILGLCPWLAWGKTSPARLGRRLWPALLAAGLAAPLAFALGVRQIAPLLALCTCAFVGASLLAASVRDGAAALRRQEGTWRAGLGRLARRRRRYGARLVHLGVVLIAVGVVGSSAYPQETEAALAPGARLGVRGYTLTYQGHVVEQEADRQSYTAVVTVSRGGRTLATLRPQKVYHWRAEQWVTETAIHATLARDLYLILAGLEADGTATFVVLINPLVAWLWIGAVLLLIGGALAGWPDTTRQAPVSQALDS